MKRAMLVGVLSCVLAVLGPPVTAQAGNAEFGRTWARDKVLRDGCHNYRYQYKVKSPESDWSLETFLIDPRKNKVGSGQMLFNSDPARGSSTFRLCRNNTVAGTFKIRGKLTYGAEEEVVWIEPGLFELVR